MEHQVTSAPRVPDKATTGTPGLDDILEGGLERRRMYLVMGESGAGKSTLGTQFLLEGARNGERCVYVSLAETPDEIAGIAASHGWSLDGIAVHKLSMATGPEHVQTVFKPVDVEMEEALRPLVDRLSRDRPHRVVIDSLTELVTYLGQRGVTPMMTLLQRGTFGAGGTLDIDASAIADAIVLLRFFEAAGSVRRAISVMKNRAGPHGKELGELVIDGRGVHVGAPLCELQGVLTGTPKLIGSAEALSHKGEGADLGR
jgi:circadian clock protein KaiC